MFKPQFRSQPKKAQKKKKTIKCIPSTSKIRTKSHVLPLIQSLSPYIPSLRSRSTSNTPNICQNQPLQSSSLLSNSKFKQHRQFSINTSQSSSTPLPAECWKCLSQNINLSDPFCARQDCKVIQHTQKAFAHQNYFQLYSLPISYNIDRNQLEKTFQQLQLRFHPDLFATKSSTEQQYAEEYSATVNRSFGILSDDLLRAKYMLFLATPELLVNDEALPEYQQVPLLHSHPLTPDENNHTKLKYDPDHNRKPRLTNQHLTMIFLKREVLEDATNDQQLFELYQENQIERNELIIKIGKEINIRLAPFLTPDKTKLIPRTDSKFLIQDFEELLTDCELLGYYQTMQRELKEKINPAIFEAELNTPT